MVLTPQAQPSHPASQSLSVKFNWSSGLGYRYSLKVLLGVSNWMILMSSQAENQ